MCFVSGFHEYSFPIVFGFGNYAFPLKGAHFLGACSIRVSKTSRKETWSMCTVSRWFLTESDKEDDTTSPETAFAMSHQSMMKSM